MTMMVTSEMKLQNCKRNAMKISKELLYDDDVLARIRKANTENEIVRIMLTARRECVL